MMTMETKQDVLLDPKHTNLKRALIAAQKRARAVEKDATNQFHKYKYASAEAMLEEAREALSEEGLAVFPVSVERDPDAKDHVWQGEGDDAWIITPRRVKVTFQLWHESGEEREFWSTVPVIPEKGRPEDKAEFGARTELLGYALRDLLLIPRVNEDAREPSGRDDRGYERRGPAARQQPSSQPPKPQNGNGAQGSPKSVASAPPPSPPANTASPSTAEPEDEPLMSPEQSAEIAGLFKALGVPKTEARRIAGEVTGQSDPFKMTTGQAAALISHLKGKVEQPAQGAAS